MSLPIKIISTDFDGTLHAEGEDPPVPHDLQALIGDLQRRGAKWVINTGRDLSSVMEGMARARLTIRPDYLVVVEREIYFREDSQFFACEAWNEACTAEHDELFLRVRADVPRLYAWVRERFTATVYEDAFSPFCLVARSNEDADAIQAYLEAYCREMPQLTVVRNDVYARFSHAGYNKGTALLNLERYGEAIVSCDEVIRLNPSSVKAHNNKGYALFNLKRYDEALVCYQQALHLNPLYVLSHCTVGKIKLALGLEKEALDSFDAAHNAMSLNLVAGFGEVAMSYIEETLSRDRESLLVKFQNVLKASAKLETEIELANPSQLFSRQLRAVKRKRDELMDEVIACIDPEKDTTQSNRQELSQTLDGLLAELDTLRQTIHTQDGISELQRGLLLVVLGDITTFRSTLDQQGEGVGEEGGGGAVCDAGCSGDGDVKRVRIDDSGMMSDK